MLTNTSLTINSTDANNKKVTNKISYVNPNITNQQALTLAQTIAALTTDTYDTTIRTDSIELDTTKPDRTIQAARVVSNSTGVNVMTDLSGDITVDFPLSKLGNNNDLQIWIRSTSFERMTKLPIIEGMTLYGLSYRTSAYDGGSFPNYWTFNTFLIEHTAQTLNYTITFPEDSTYAEKVINFTVNITEEE